jgi:plastocyanin
MMSALDRAYNPDITSIVSGVFTHKIMIHVDAIGNMFYTPTVLRAQAGDFIFWRSTDGDFSISFNRSPFVDAFLQSHTSGATTETDPEEIRAGSSGSYHYDVAVRRNEDGRIWFKPGSPEIFI